MPTYPAPVLEIIYGSTTINLLARGKGWHLTGFRPRTAELKNGGTWQSSPLSNGRQPVSYRYDNIIDTWTVSADGYREDSIIELAQELERAGVSALDYWTADWADTPVYIKARGPKETNTRYAIIHQIRVPEYADQYRQPMFGLESPVMDGLSVIIEHGQWQNVAPGEQECVELSSLFEWDLDTWSANTAPTGDVYAMIQASSGRILAGTGDAAKVFYSDDDGSTWGLLATLGASTDICTSFAQNGSGVLFAGVSGGSAKGVYVSSNSGLSWTKATVSGTTVEDVRGLAWHPTQSHLWVASYGGGTRVRPFTVSGTTITATSEIGVLDSFAFPEDTTPFLIHSSGYVFVALRLTGSGAIGRYLPGGAYDVPILLSGSGGQTLSLIEASDGKILAGNASGSVFQSPASPGTSGDAWTSVWSGDASNVYDFAIDAEDVIYATDTGNSWKSEDDGITWSLYSTVFVGEARSIVITAAGTQIVSDDDDIYRLSASNIQSGNTATCSNRTYAANKTQITNLTHIKVYDASATSFTDVFPMTSYPVELLPSTPANDDAVYFGIDTSLTDVDTGPFSSLVFDLSSPFVGWATVAWEYWDGSAWSALTVKDNTLSLLQTGVNSVHWVPPSNWATTAVDGLTGYWVRFRVDAIATSPEPPAQQNRNIYAVVNPYIEIAASQIGGDIPALARVRVENVSDRDGPGGSAPDLYTNRVIMGLRSVSRGALFTAYLNAADEQNPVGVTVTAGTDTTFANAIGAPSGRIAQWSPTGTGSWVTILTFTLATTIATQYYGTFRVFLRARQSGGTAGQMQLRLRTSTGSGGVSITTDAQVFANVNDHQIIDFGQLTIPLSAYLKSTELGDVLTIAVQGNTSSTTPDANLYDLVLMPVDEWAADLTDGENSATSALASGFYLDVDSVSFPKRQLRNAVKSTGTNYTKAIWQQVANGPAILQANERQRLWLLTLRTASAGSSDWRSEPDAVHRVQMWSAERYRWARGSR